MSLDAAVSGPGDYRTRRYRPADVTDVLALDRTVWNRERSREWFRWKYERNPHVDEPPVFVAEGDGEIVGARPFMGFRLRAGRDGETTLALQAADTMVHPAHRRRGIFTAMNELALAHHGSGRRGVYFNFPNEQSRPCYENLRWRTVRPKVTYYRIERPSAFLGGSAAERMLAAAADPSASGYATLRRVVDEGTNPPGDGLEVERIAGAPVDRLAAVYERRVPDRLHVDRSEEFLSWRLASPAWSRETYVATRDGEDVAALVGRTRELRDGTVLSQVADVLPLVGGPRWEEALAALLGAFVDGAPESDVFAAVRGPIPHDLLTASGFLPDDQLPLSRLTDGTATLVTRPFDLDEPAPWTWNDRRLDRSESWLLSFLARDTA